MSAIKQVPSLRFIGYTDAWEQRKVGDFAKVLSAARVHKHEWTEQGVPFFRSSDVMRVHNGRENEKVYISQELFEDLSMVSGRPEKGDIFITGGGSIGMPYIVPNDNPLYSKDADLLWIKKSENHNSQYLYSYFFTPTFRNYIASISHIGTIAHYTIVQVKETPVLLPKIREQEKIGSFFSNLDNLITLHQRKYEKLVSIKKSMLEKMFPKNGERVPEVRFSGFTDAWELRKVGEYGEFYYGRSAPKWSVTEDATTPCVRYGELYTKFGSKIDRVYSYTNIPSDKLVFSRGTEVLIPRVGEDPMDYNHCTWLSLKGVAIGEMISVYNTRQNPLFTAIMFNATLQEEFAKRVEGGSVTNLYYHKLKNIEVSFPNQEEQSKIASFFSKIENLITLHQRKYERLQNLKKAYLERMFV